jgi:ribonucleoside-diphosphate reductase alpha chain
MEMKVKSINRRRNMHLAAVAPNANSSIICGCSASIEPIKSNAYTHRTRAGAHLVKNKALEEVLDGHGENTEATWKSIISNEGSVQHLDFLTEQERQVFRTAFELDQAWVVEHAAKRQEFICQGQSVNLFFPSGSPKPYVNAVHIKAWKEGLKGLYYLRTNAGVSADKVGASVERNALKDFESDNDDAGDECMSCQG